METEVTFGAIFQEKDKRDFDLSMVGADTPIPSSFRPDYSKVEVRHQHKQPACGSHAGSTLEGILALNNKEEGINNSPRNLWKNIKDNDGWPIDVGTDLYAILKNLKSFGVCDISLMENDKAANSLSLLDYRNATITDVMKKAASERVIEAFATTYSPTFKQIKRAIYINGACIIQYKCGKNMCTAKNGKSSWFAKDILPLSPDAFPMESGHFVVGIGYDEDYIYFRNSWGTTWAMKGDGYFGSDYIKFVYAIGTAIDKKNITTDVIPKYLFMRNISEGYSGQDVSALQRILEAEGYLTMPKNVKYGYFGPLTKNAVCRFQDKYSIATLADAGYGYVGPKTRAKLNELYA